MSQIETVPNMLWMTLRYDIMTALNAAGQPQRSPIKGMPVLFLETGPLTQSRFHSLHPQRLNLLKNENISDGSARAKVTWGLHTEH